MMMKSKMDGGPKQPEGKKTTQPKFPNPGDKSLTSAYAGEKDSTRSGVAPTPKSLGGRANG